MPSSTQSEGAFRSAANRFIQFSNLLERAAWAISILLFTLLVSLTIATVFTRQVLNFVPSWSGEVQRYLAIWMTLLLAGPLIFTDDHLSVRIFNKYFSDRTLYYIRQVQLVMILSIGVVFVNWGTEYVLDSGMASTSPSVNIQMLWIYLILPLTGWLIVIFTLARMLKIKMGEEVLPDEQGSESDTVSHGEVS